MSSSVRRAAVRLGALLGATALALSGCSGDSSDPDASTGPGGTGSSAAPTATPTPEPPRRPRKGDCHRLSWEEALAPTADTQPDDCGNATAVTFYVGTLKKRADGTPHDVDSRVVADQLAKACPRELRSFLGGTKEDRRLSLLTTVWFTPTLQEAAAGADWYRCDLVAPGRDGKLLRVRRGMRDALTQDRAGKYALCATGKAGEKSFRHVPCSRSHTWRAVAAVDLTGEKYPGREQVAEQMADACTDRATELAADKLDVRWTQEGPTKTQWKAGRRHGVCWVPTT